MAFWDDLVEEKETIVEKVESAKKSFKSMDSESEKVDRTPELVIIEELDEIKTDSEKLDTIIAILVDKSKPNNRMLLMAVNNYLSIYNNAYQKSKHNPNSKTKMDYELMLKEKIRLERILNEGYLA